MDKRKDKITVLEIVIAATQVLTVICIFKGNTAWKGSLSILFIGIAASLFDKLRETKERPYLYMTVFIIASEMVTRSLLQTKQRTKITTF